MPANPAQTVTVDPVKLASYRASYRFMSYILEERGTKVRGDLPGIDRPEDVNTLKASAQTATAKPNKAAAFRTNGKPPCECSQAINGAANPLAVKPRKYRTLKAFARYFSGMKTPVAGFATFLMSSGIER